MKKTSLIGAAALLAMAAMFGGCASDNKAVAENGTAAKSCCADKEAKAGTCTGEAKASTCTGEAKASTCTGGEAKASGCCADKAASTSK